MGDNKWETEKEFYQLADMGKEKAVHKNVLLSI